MASRIPAGRPRKLNDAVIDAISAAVAQGNYIYTACALAGFSYEALKKWRSQAHKDEAIGLTEAESVHLRLLNALKKAEAEAENALVQVVREAATVKREWIPAMTLLERRHPDRWGRRDRMSVDVSERRQINITRVTMVAPGAGGSPGGQVIEGEVVVKELGEGEKEEAT